MDTAPKYHNIPCLRHVVDEQLPGRFQGSAKVVLPMDGVPYLWMEIDEDGGNPANHRWIHLEFVRLSHHVARQCDGVVVSGANYAQIAPRNKQTKQSGEAGTFPRVCF